jgi:hypothetical protein
MGRDGRYDRSAFAHGLPHHLYHASSPLPLPSLPTHPPALSPAPNPPGGRPARWAERRRHSRGLARLRRSERTVYPAAAAAHALRPLRRQPVGALVHSVAGMRSNVLEPHRRAIGPQGRQGSPVVRDQRLVLARRPCASRGADRDLRVGENLLTWPHQLACARQCVGIRGFWHPFWAVTSVTLPRLCHPLASPRRPASPSASTGSALTRRAASIAQSTLLLLSSDLVAYCGSLVA